MLGMLDPRLSRNILVSLLLLVAFSLPLFIKLNSLSIIAFAVFAATTRFRYLRIRNISLLFLIYFVLHLLGMLYSENRTDGWALVERSTPYLLLPLLLACAPDLTRKDIHKIFVAFVIGTILSAILNYGYSFSVNIDSEPLMIYRVYLAMYLVMSLALIYGLWLAYRPAGKRQEIALWLGGLLTVLLIVAFQTKMAILIACVIILGIFFSAPIKPALRLATFAFFVFLLVATALYPETSSRFIELFKRGDLPRLYNWQASVQLIEQYFFTGVGTGDALNALNTKRDVSWFDAFKTYNAHNQYLETFLRFGVVGFVTLLSILYYQIRIAIKTKNFFYSSFLLIFSLSMLTESMLVRNKGITFFAFFSGLNFLLAARAELNDRTSNEAVKN
jgi:O-antigen ligase